jgi:hypothetical protein
MFPRSCGDERAYTRIFFTPARSMNRLPARKDREEMTGYSVMKATSYQKHTKLKKNILLAYSSEYSIRSA